jgi:hypothetical protein
MLFGVLVSAAPQCATFTPKTCMHSEEVVFRGRQCHPQRCDFDADEVRFTDVLTPFYTQINTFNTFERAAN